MPTLDFKGKSFIYAHHLSVPFRELVIDPKKSLPAKGQKPTLDDNLIIQGDNLHALKAPLSVYAGKVDCIVIDPPYNTGGRDPRPRHHRRRQGPPPQKRRAADLPELFASKEMGEDALWVLNEIIPLQNSIRADVVAELPHLRETAKWAARLARPDRFPSH